MFSRRAAAALAAVSLTILTLSPGADAAPRNRVTGPSGPSAGMTLFATHPMASNSFIPCDGGKLCASGQTITDMNVDASGRLIAGYGDWGTNSDSNTGAAGKVAAVPLSLTPTAQWGAAYLLGTEAVGVIRRAADGSLWIPMTDPSSRSSGVATDRGGTWRHIADGQNMYHTFDVAEKAGGDLWLFGSKDVSGVGASGVVARSTDQGSTWSQSYTHRYGGDSADWSRFYTGMVTPVGTVLTGGMGGFIEGFAFDGTQWQEDYSPLPMEPRLAERFADGYVTVSGSRPYYVSWTGSPASRQQTALSYPAGLGLENTVKDFYVGVDGALFYLAGTTVVRVDPDTLASRIIATGVSGTSIVVHDGYIYAGSTGGTIYRSVKLDTDGVADEPVAEPAPVKGGGRKK